MEKLKNFNAEQARQITDSYNDDILYEILRKIKEKAQHNESELHLYEPVIFKVIEKLESRGFEVKQHSGIAVQRDGLYCTISW